MKKDFLNGMRRVHFIGIGGSGMYPLAQILHGLGYVVTGSDNNDTDTLRALREMGVNVFLDQRAENVSETEADLFVYTSAVFEDNPELAAARASGREVMERSELLGLITGFYDNAVCVGGTHGKTTVTSMLTQIMVMAGLDISAVIGGKLECIHGGGRFGSSDVIVCEACEFNDHFLNLQPDICVILNIDEDHLDYFKTLDNVVNSFRRFANNAAKAVIINGGDKNTLNSVEGLPESIKRISFGLSNENDYYPANIRRYDGAYFEYVLMEKGDAIREIKLNVAGEHNVLNSVAAAAAALYLGVTAEQIKNGLESFKGAARRFEKYGEKNGIAVYDDYAHHPAEIAATLKAAKDTGYRRIWAVHQPFTFSRTANMADDFAKTLRAADKVVLTSIMGGREKNLQGIKTGDLAAKIDGCVWFDEEEHDRNFELVRDYVCENARAGDMVITLGCGDVNKLAKMILAGL
jgi:UDP-N-acetylmuramate--alanine ligase